MQLSNAKLSIVLTLLSSTKLKLARDVQFAKALPLIFLILEFNFTDSNFVQPANDCAETVVIVSISIFEKSFRSFLLISKAV